MATHTYLESKKIENSLTLIEIRTILNNIFTNFFDFRKATKQEELLGIDYIVITKDMKEINIDLKVREKYFGDTLIELQHSDNQPTWLQKESKTDFVVYVYKDIKEAHAFDFKKLKELIINNLAKLLNKKGSLITVRNYSKTNNRHYSTINYTADTIKLCEKVKNKRVKY